MKSIHAVLCVALLVGCNFDAAFKRYCDKNPNCRTDAAVGTPDTTPPQPDAPLPTQPDAPPRQPDTYVPPPPDTSPDAPLSITPDAALPPDVARGQNFTPASFVPTCGPNRPPCPDPRTQFCPQGGQFCLIRCTTNADCVGALGHPNCALVPGSQSTYACQCDPYSCNVLVDTVEYRCNLVDEGVCMRKCNTNADCDSPAYTPPRNCDQFGNVCVKSRFRCGSDFDCQQFNPAKPRCDLNSFTCF